jgi:hypothetical protein
MRDSTLVPTCSKKPKSTHFISGANQQALVMRAIAIDTLITEVQIQL